jgi:hypothetical protein
MTQRSHGPRNDRLSTPLVDIDDLEPADSPRQGGEDPERVRNLAASKVPFSPILVHRDTMRVIDGMHRLKAARQRGDQLIPVEFFDGAEQLAFVMGVKANVTHGLPLSRADREAAARRILSQYPRWSDRMIANTCGLSDKTVKKLRCASADLSRLHTRVGKDGRVRPVNTAEGRRIASEVLTAQPDASLRDVATIAGISPGTVRDVRLRMQRGQNPVPDQQLAKEAGRAQAASAHPSVRERTVRLVSRGSTTLAMLSRDPSLLHSDTGRVLLRWLHVTTVTRANWRAIVDRLPHHCVHVVADQVRQQAEHLHLLAKELEQRGKMDNAS